MPFGSGRLRTRRENQDLHKRLSPRRKRQRTPPNVVVKFGFLLEEINTSTEKIAAIRKVRYFPLPEVHDWFLREARSVNAISETGLFTIVSQASKAVRDSVSSIEISSFPLVHDALEEYSLYVTDFHYLMIAETVYWLPWYLASILLDACHCLRSEPTNRVRHEALIHQTNLWIEAYKVTLNSYASFTTVTVLILSIDRMSAISEQYSHLRWHLFISWAS